MYGRVAPALPTAAVVAAAVLFGAAVFLGAACGGGDGGGEQLDIDGYFEEVERLAQAFDERGAVVDDEFSALNEADTEEEAFALTRDYVSQVDDLLREFVDGLDEIEPPDELETEHEAAVAAGRQVVDAVSSVEEQANEAESAADLEAAFSGLLALDEESAAFTDSCLELQGYADGNDIEVDLRCG